MVLTDHDYAPMRDNSGEGVMFLITQPAEQTEEHDAKCSVSEPELPVLEKEPPPPELIAESPCALPMQIKYSNIPPVLTRENIIPHDGTDTVLSVDEEIISDSVVSERNADDVMVIEEIQTTEGSIQKLTEGSNNQETQVEHVEGLDSSEGDKEEMRTDEGNQEGEVTVTGSVEDSRLKETSITKEGIIQEQKEQEAAAAAVEEEEEEEGEDDDDDDDDDESKQASTMKTYSPIKKPVASNVPIRRQPPVQMADIMKEWDDFDDDDVEDQSSEPFPQSESEIKPVASEEEPKVLRGPVSGGEQ
jgi:hypothetical protein